MYGCGLCSLGRTAPRGTVGDLCARIVCSEQRRPMSTSATQATVSRQRIQVSSGKTHVLLVDAARSTLSPRVGTCPQHKKRATNLNNERTPKRSACLAATQAISTTNPSLERQDAPPARRRRTKHTVAACRHMPPTQKNAQQTSATKGPPTR